MHAATTTTAPDGFCAPPILNAQSVGGTTVSTTRVSTKKRAKSAAFAAQLVISMKKASNAPMKPWVGKIPRMKKTVQSARSKSLADEYAAAGGTSAAECAQAHCYYPKCRNACDARAIGSCIQCNYYYCDAAHMKKCGQCHRSVCVICMRDIVYRNIVNSIVMSGPAAAQRAWCQVIANVSLCAECTDACPCCRVPMLVNGYIACKVCGRNTCVRCVVLHAPAHNLVCNLCHFQMVLADHEIARILVALQRTPQ